MSKHVITDSQKSQIEGLAKNAFDTYKEYKHLFVLVEQLPNAVRMTAYHGNIESCIYMKCDNGVPPSKTFYEAFLDIFPQFHSVKNGFTFHFFEHVETLWKLWDFLPKLRYAEL
jgi:hypothetical protein